MQEAAPAPPPAARRLRVAVVGSGIAGLSCAWLLSQRHDVTVYEKDSRPGGHSYTVTVPTPEGTVAVDTGFIVYNDATYPNLRALFDHLGVPTVDSDMSFGISVDHGRLEYAGSTSRASLFAQRRNILRPRFWSMLRDLVRFYRTAPGLLTEPGAEALTLGEYLDREGYGAPFVDDHLLPMGAAIWSAAVEDMRGHPATEFIRFCDNHGLLKLRDRPVWRTVAGGSREYVSRLAAPLAGGLRLGVGAAEVWRQPEGPCMVVDTDGGAERFDHVVLACHADQALALLRDPSAREAAVLDTFRTQPNQAWLHTDPRLMPRRRKAWASWNYLSHTGRDGRSAVCVTYWMNRLQPLATKTDLFVTLNPDTPPRDEAVLARIAYRHPLFDRRAARARDLLWGLQGRRNTWFCGAWFGAGFHEDGLQAGLAVAEQLGGVRRPWAVENESGRIPLRDRARPFPGAEEVSA
ncbi:NAD(P)/FAD-dependent oxidoreductase [Caenispirillum salinarum]|uniref:NAD(P)/FAD-dependent oxidoreductase n=1 Tax=Caenispirillum salinarum TaxID=859058 RepID=UPI00384D93F8